MQDTNREVRKDAYKLLDNFFKKNEKKLDEIFDNLVKIRNKKAEVLKLKNFIPLGYLNMNRSDYGPKEVEEYRKQIVKHIVPLVKKINKKENLFWAIVTCMSMTHYILKKVTLNQKEE